MSQNLKPNFARTSKNASSFIIPVLLIAMLTSGTSSFGADISWIGATGNWNLAGNWSPAQLPGPGDNVFITNNGVYTVSMPAGFNASVGSLTLGGATGTQTLLLDRSTLTIAGASVIEHNGQLALTVSQSLVNGAGNLTVNGSISWANGSMTGSGTTMIGGSGSVAIGSGGVTFGRTLTNNGKLSWAGGNLTLSTGVTLNNQPGATFEITADGRLSGTATTPINNSGLVRQTAGTAGTTITAPFNNSVTLEVNASTLSLNLGGTHTGTMNIAQSATLNFGGGNHVLSASSLVTGAGVLSVTGNGTTLNATGTFDPNTILSANSGTVTLAPNCVVTGTTLNIGGILNYNSSGAVAAVNLNSGTLGGDSPITVTGLLTLSGGTITNALVNANGGLIINGNTTLSATRLVNPVAATWSAGNITGANGAVISNLFGAIFNNTFDGRAASGAGATPVFVNAGTFEKTGGTAAQGATAIDFQFINTGTVDVQTNTLRYAINQQLSGLTHLDGGNLDVQAQPLQLSGGELAGSGSVTLANTQNLLNSAIVSPGAPLGELDVVGNYQQSPSGALNIELGGYLPGTNFDLVSVTSGGAGGLANLNGTLNVTLANGFLPTNGATFTFLKAVSRAGTFSTFNYPTNEIGIQLTYDATSATLKVVNLKPLLANPLPDPAPVTYGDTFSFQVPADTFVDPDNDPLAYSATGMPGGITFNPATRSFFGIAGQAGVFTVTVTASDNGTPSLSATNTFKLAINPAPLTITAINALKVYGAVPPTLAVSYNGFVNADTADSLTAVPVATTSAAAGSPVGSYQITASGAVDSNYTISYVPGTLTVTPAPLTVTALDAQRAYGQINPVFAVGYSGFVNGETNSALSGSLSFGTLATNNSPVGTYAITPGGLTASNYSVTFASGTLTVLPQDLTILVHDETKTYGETNPPFTVSYSGFVNSETNTQLNGSLIFNTVAATNSPVGTYAITAGGLTSTNYSIAVSNGTLTVLAQPLTVAAQNAGKVYGAVDPVFAANYSGFVNGEDNTALGGSLVLSRQPGENVGAYPITPSGLLSTNYSITFVGAEFAITPAPLTITADNQSKPYGAALPAMTLSYSGFVNGDTPASLSVSPTTSTIATPASPVGAYSIDADGAVDSNYAISYAPGTLTVMPTALTVLVEDAARAYGQTNPPFAVTYSGFVNGETNTVLGGAVLFDTPAETNSPIGTYPITASGLNSTNYSITYSNGTLTILPHALTITALNQTKVYGQTDPEFAVIYSGFVNLETNTVLNGALVLSRQVGENVGSYPITASGLSSTNYALTYVPGTLSITPASLQVIVADATRGYGQANPDLSASYSGFVRGETASVLSGTLTLGTTADIASPVGAYPITAAGLASTNYSITYVNGTLNVLPRALTITALDRTKVYGQSDPKFAVIYSGFVNGETNTALTGALLVSRQPGENVGNYPLTPSGLTSSNYTITFTSGNLTITPAPLTITADDQAKLYGASIPTLTVHYTGFVNGDTPASLAVQPSASTGATASSGVGTYPITVAGAIDANYAITYAPGTLTITPASLSVIMANATRLYGETNPVFTATYSGFVNGENASVLDGALSIATIADAQSPVGDYPITGSGLTSSNYSITFLPGTLTVTAGAPVILGLKLDSTNVTVTWSSAANADYRLQYKDSLDAPWTDIDGDVPATASTASKSTARTTAIRFYRVQLVK